MDIPNPGQSSQPKDYVIIHYTNRILQSHKGRIRQSSIIAFSLSSEQRHLPDLYCPFLVTSTIIPCQICSSDYDTDIALERSMNRS